ncbi:MAG: threonine synthase [Melioribacteraceae bacterium]
MKFYSTNNPKKLISFETAVMNGIAEDGGLYMPVEIPTLRKDFVENIENFSFREIAFHIAEKFIGNDIEPGKLRNIIDEAINFPAPLVKLTSLIRSFPSNSIPFGNSTSREKELSNNKIASQKIETSTQKAENFTLLPSDLSVLELFHGPTLAFKDFGARFMARVMGHFVADSEKELNILVATSGDTGSAVAYGFYETLGINVYILYPKGKVSEIQEKQLTTLDKNITAIEIEGTFDDCQRLVKKAMTDIDLKEKNLSSANSINIARLIPQIFYYFEMYRQIIEKKENIFVSVPSGNLGNLTAGLIAKKMGLPITKFISSLNSNSVFAEYVSSGEFIPRSSVQTISNAMDVGNPSNLVRIAELYKNDMEALRNDVYSESFSDEETKKAITEVYKKYNYIIDPHGAVGYLGVNSHIKKIMDQSPFYKSKNDYIGIILETAHPAKFKETVENVFLDKIKATDENVCTDLGEEAVNEKIKIEIPIPERLGKCLLKEKHVISLPSDYPSFKQWLST